MTGTWPRVLMSTFESLLLLSDLMLFADLELLTSLGVTLSPNDGIVAGLIVGFADG